MGSMGSDAAIEAKTDIVLMDDDVTKIASVVRIARKTLRIVKQNIVFALAIKSTCSDPRRTWYGEYVGGRICGCRSFCHRNLKFHAYFK